MAAAFTSAFVNMRLTAVIGVPAQTVWLSLVAIMLGVGFTVMLMGMSMAPQLLETVKLKFAVEDGVPEIRASFDPVLLPNTNP